MITPRPIKLNKKYFIYSMHPPRKGYLIFRMRLIVQRIHLFHMWRLSYHTWRLQIIVIKVQINLVDLNHHLFLMQYYNWLIQTYRIAIQLFYLILHNGLNNLKISLHWFADFIKNRNLKNNKKEDIPSLIDFSQAAWTLISPIYKGGWDALKIDNINISLH